MEIYLTFVSIIYKLDTKTDLEKGEGMKVLPDSYFLSFARFRSS